MISATARVLIPQKWRTKHCPVSLLSRRRFLSTGTTPSGPSPACMWASWSCAAQWNRSGCWCLRGSPTCYATRASVSTPTSRGNRSRPRPALLSIASRRPPRRPGGGPVQTRLSSDLLLTPNCLCPLNRAEQRVANHHHHPFVTERSGRGFRVMFTQPAAAFRTY